MEKVGEKKKKRTKRVPKEMIKDRIMEDRMKFIQGMSMDTPDASSSAEERMEEKLEMMEKFEMDKLWRIKDRIMKDRMKEERMEEKLEMMKKVEMEMLHASSTSKERMEKVEKKKMDEKKKMEEKKKMDEKKMEVKKKMEEKKKVDKKRRDTSGASSSSKERMKKVDKKKMDEKKVDKKIIEWPRPPSSSEGKINVWALTDAELKYLKVEVKRKLVPFNKHDYLTTLDEEWTGWKKNEEERERKLLRYKLDKIGWPIFDKSDICRVDLVPHETRHFSKEAMDRLETWRRHRFLASAARVSSYPPVYLDIHVHALGSNMALFKLIFGESGFTVSRFDIDTDENHNIGREGNRRIQEELSGLIHCGSTLWNSNIVFLGGVSRNSRDDKSKSDKVFVYNLVTESWDHLRPMQSKRGAIPIVVGVDDYIFVFGGYPFTDDFKEYYTTHDKPACTQEAYMQYYEAVRKMKPQRWAEYYDKNTKLWSYLPEHAPQCFTRHYLQTFSHAVCPNQHLILFWIDYSEVVSFDYKNWKWAQYQYGPSISRSQVWSFKPVVIEDFLFWNDDIAIYAHDLCGHVTLPVCKLPTSSSDDYYARSLLVDIGGGMMCLLGTLDDVDIYYTTFKIQISHGVGVGAVRDVEEAVSHGVEAASHGVGAVDDVEEAASHGVEAATHGVEAETATICLDVVHTGILKTSLLGIRRFSIEHAYEMDWLLRNVELP